MKLKTLIKSLGPGLLWAGAAIGVSHLVQSTRAGAMYGFQLVWLILLVNFLKYPFFEFGPRYAIATGESLLSGYKRIGKWGIILYFILTIGTMFTLQAAVTAVTAGIYAYVFPDFLSPFYWAVVILAASVVLIAIGKYSVLDKFIKIIIVLLAISTVVAVIAASSKGFNPNPEFAGSFEWNAADIAFLIAIAGWMPTAIDVSVWHSVWTLAKEDATGYKPKLKESLFDFNVGYIGTAVLSIGFVALGAYVMYGTGKTFSANSVEFSGQLINLFVSSLGTWAFAFISIAALTTMTSTTITCLDAYPRVLKSATVQIAPKTKNKANIVAWIWMTVLLAGTLIILRYFASSMRFLVDLATTLSFLTGPILGWMNYKAITSNYIAEEYRPPKWLRIMSWIGLIVMTAFSIYFLYVKFV